VFGHPSRPVISHWPDRPAARVRAGARVADSLLSSGCDVAGEVDGCVLGPGVVVEKGARVVDSVLFEDVAVRAGAEIQTSVVDVGCEIGPGARVGAVPTARVAADDEIVLVGAGSTVDSLIAAGARLEPGTTA
jgi:glucose-1-phosphate adenylyltransferase